MFNRSYSSTRKTRWPNLKFSTSKWVFDSAFSELLQKVQGLVKGADEQEVSFEERAERLNHLFVDKIIPFYRELTAETLQSNLQEQLTDFQTQEYITRDKIAEGIR